MGEIPSELLMLRFVSGETTAANVCEELEISLNLYKRHCKTETEVN
jgi:hypothetical protein